MASERPDDKIKEVLIRAAMVPEFHDRLLKDRAAALDGMGLSPAERNLLMADDRADPSDVNCLQGRPRIGCS